MRKFALGDLVSRNNNDIHVVINVHVNGISCDFVCVYAGDDSCYEVGFVELNFIDRYNLLTKEDVVEMFTGGTRR